MDNIYSQSSMLSIEYILVDFQKQGKQNILCKIPASIGNEEAGKAWKQAKDI